VTGLKGSRRVSFGRWRTTECARGDDGRMGNRDEFVRTGGRDVDTRLPMALRVQAADRVMAAGRAVSGSHAV
jgi:hypothetical protein